MSHFSCIGLTAANAEEFETIVGKAFDLAVDVPGTRGSEHRCWRDASGAEIAFHLGADSIDCVTPCFSAPGGLGKLRVHTLAPAEDTECRHCGGVDCDLLDADGQLVTRATVQLEYFTAWREWLRVERTFDLELAVFADLATFCPDLDALDKAQAPMWGDAKTPDGKPLRLSEEAFMPEGMFGPKETPVTGRATALFTGRVEQVATLKNQLTGLPFLHCKVRTLPGLLDVVADPALVEGTPAVGEHVLARGWLVGSPVGTPPDVATA